MALALAATPCLHRNIAPPLSASNPLSLLPFPTTDLASMQRISRPFDSINSWLMAMYEAQLARRPAARADCYLTQVACRYWPDTLMQSCRL